MLSVIISLDTRHPEQCEYSLVHSSFTRHPAELRSQQALHLLYLLGHRSGAL